MSDSAKDILSDHSALSPLPQTVEQAKERLLACIAHVAGQSIESIDVELGAEADALIAACRAEATAPLQATIDRLVSIHQRLEQQVALWHGRALTAEATVAEQAQTLDALKINRDE